MVLLSLQDSAQYMDYRNENDLVRDILYNLHELNRIHPKHKDKIFVWRNNTGASERPDISRRSGRRLVRFGKVGSSDILGSFHGAILCIECKFGRGKTTPLQDEFLEQIHQTGGIAFIARSWKDVEQNLEL